MSNAPGTCKQYWQTHVSPDKNNDKKNKFKTNGSYVHVLKVIPYVHKIIKEKNIQTIIMCLSVSVCACFKQVCMIDTCVMHVREFKSQERIKEANVPCW